MGKRKVFRKTDLSIPGVERSLDAAGHLVVPSEAIPPANTVVKFVRNASSRRSFDFARWYDAGIDQITYACQRQIERFLAGQDGEREVTTVTVSCAGLCKFLDYMVLRAVALRCELTLVDVDREVIDGFLAHLAEPNLSKVSQKCFYSQVKSVLYALGKRGLIALVKTGDLATFPRNPFPHVNRNSKGETRLPQRQRQAFATALKQAVMPIWHSDIQPTGELLAYALLVVALHSGRNTTPLLEMRSDCLRPHPKNNVAFLVLWKRRGHSSNKVALRAECPADLVLESTSPVRNNVVSLIKRVLTITEPLRAEISDDLKERVWLYRGLTGRVKGEPVPLTEATLFNAIKKLVANYSLTDTDDRPLRINISRLRKTFANRVFELLQGDLPTTAIALGNTPKVADRNYLAPDESSRRNWQFMGEILVMELLNRSIGATYKISPTGRCRDPAYGQYAPKQAGSTCYAFLNCLRCKHYAVTADDLYRLFSFYFRVLAERAQMSRQRWEREYAHIPRLIDNYVVGEGVRRGVFKPAAVEAARQHARREPHPFWSFDVIPSMEIFA